MVTKSKIQGIFTGFVDKEGQEYKVEELPDTMEKTIAALFIKIHLRKQPESTAPR